MQCKVLIAELARGQCPSLLTAARAVAFSSGHTSPPSPRPSLPSPGHRLPVVDILLSSQRRDVKYLYPRWNVSLYCLVNFLIESRQTISLPFPGRSRKRGLVLSGLRFERMMEIFRGADAFSPTPAPSQNTSTGPINHAVATCVGNINLVEDVDGFLSVPTHCSDTFLPIRRGGVEEAF